MKTCTKCHVAKSATSFSVDRRIKTGFKSHCKECCKTARKAYRSQPNNREREKRTRAEWDEKNRSHVNLRQKLWRDRPENRDRLSRQRVENNYGISTDRYCTMLLSQMFSCAICTGSFDDTAARKPNIDHDHDTGEVRGLLCANCNHAIGKMKDNPDILRRAAAYVEDGGFRCDMFPVQK